MFMMGGPPNCKCSKEESWNAGLQVDYLPSSHDPQVSRSEDQSEKSWNDQNRPAPSVPAAPSRVCHHYDHSRYLGLYGHDDYGGGYRLSPRRSPYWGGPEYSRRCSPYGGRSRRYHSRSPPNSPYGSPRHNQNVYAR